MKIRIGNKKYIGDGCPPFLIAEAGINHNGDIEKAYAMISVAKEAGADAVKFQTFKAEEFIGDPEMVFTYKSQGKEVTESMLEMFRRCEFGRDVWFLLKKRCDDESIMFLSTPQNRSDLDLLLEVGITAIKVGSDDFTNIPLLKSYASTGLPVIISCGMSDMAEVYQTLEAVGALDGHPTVLMLCTSEYPTPPEDVNLLKLRTLGNVFPDIVLGFSDHTQGPLASSLAAAMGAKVFEKHFTLDHNLPGPDHWFSEEPTKLKEWVSYIRTSRTMLGDAIVRPTVKEKEMIKLARRCIVASSNISVDEILSSDNIGLKRVRGGLSSLYYENLIGLKAARNIEKNSIIRWGDFK
ncbi:MAG: N-acetylneuraminate synthase family protein [Planctomycetia bacterium]|nr:N-acetylneuraminate synthase family protein [Planctomycetia bacterium]